MQVSLFCIYACLLGSEDGLTVQAGNKSATDGMSELSIDSNPTAKVTHAAIDNPNSSSTQKHNAVPAPENTAKRSVCKQIIQFFSLTKEGATPVQWKILLLIVGGLVSVEIFRQQPLNASLVSCFLLMYFIIINSYISIIDFRTTALQI